MKMRILPQILKIFLKHFMNYYIPLTCKFEWKWWILKFRKNTQEETENLHVFIFIKETESIIKIFSPSFMSEFFQTLKKKILNFTQIFQRTEKLFLNSFNKSIYPCNQNLTS